MRIQRAVACLVIAFYAIGQWTASAHHAHARHVRCAEHGELVDVRAVSLSPNDYDSTGHATLVAAGNDGGLSGEDHCAYAQSSRPVVTESGAHAHAFTLPLTSGVIAPPVESPYPPLPPLSLAPKTSPPGTSSVAFSQPGFFTHSDEVLVCVRPSLHLLSRSLSRSLAAPPWSTATSVHSSIQPPVA